MAWTCACGQENEDQNRFCNQCGAPKDVAPASGGEAEIEVGQDSLPVPPANLPPAPQSTPAPTGELLGKTLGTEPKKKSRALPIILILLAVGLIAVCVIGIVAAIAMPNLLSAIQRGKQKRAMGEVRSIATACASYSTDKGGYPDTGRNEDSYYSIVDVSKLKPFLEPGYLATVPEKDPWGSPYSYGISKDRSAFVVICNGSDGKNTLEKIPDAPVTTSCFEDEIVWENDTFIQRPEGPQKKCK